MVWTSDWAPGGKAGPTLALGAQVHAMYLSEQKGRSQNPHLPRPHLRVGSGGKGISLGNPCVTWGLLKVSRFFLFVSVLLPAAFGWVLTWYGLGFCYSVVVAALSIMLQCYRFLYLILVTISVGSSQYWLTVVDDLCMFYLWFLYPDITKQLQSK